MRLSGTIFPRIPFFFCLCLSLLAFPVASSAQIPGLLTFRAVKLGDDAHLEWKVSTKSLVYDFILQRSLDHLDFDALGVVRAGGSMKAPDTYGFVDPNIAVHHVDTIYYRLVQIGPQGENYVSETVGLSQNEQKGLIVDAYPHPGEETTLSVAYLSAQPGDVLLQIVNPEGKVCYFQTLEARDRFQVHRVGTVHWLAGTYRVRLINDQFVATDEIEWRLPK